MMNAEYYHQFYGGDIADHFVQKKQNNLTYKDFDTSQDICDIYNTQIKGKPSIDTTGIFSNSTNISFASNIERDPHFTKIETDFKKVLNSIADQLDLRSNDDSVEKFTPSSIQLRDQTTDDIAAANNEVMRALEELKNLGADS